MVTELQIAIISGLFSMMSWGFADFFAKKTVDKIDDLRTLFWSQIFGMIPVFVYWFFNFELPIFTFQIIFYLITLSFFGTFGILLFYRGLSKGKASVIAPVYSSYAAFAVLVSFLIFHEIIIGLTWLGLGIIFIGIILASFDYRKLKDVDFKIKDLSKGVPETLIAAVIIGLYFPLWDKFLVGQGWIVFNLLTNIIICLTILTISLSKRSTLKFEDKKLWKWLFLIGFFTSGGFLCLVWGFNSTSFTSIISVLSAASPILVLILARIFLKEKLSLTQKLGVALLLAGLVVISV